MCLDFKAKTIHFPFNVLNILPLSTLYEIFKPSVFSLNYHIKWKCLACLVHHFLCVVCHLAYTNNQISTGIYCKFLFDGAICKNLLYQQDITNSSLYFFAFVYCKVRIWILEEYMFHLYTYRIWT